MTINKSQGQTFKVAGINLGDACVCGQLYVACSRVGMPQEFLRACRTWRTDSTMRDEINTLREDIAKLSEEICGVRFTILSFYHTASPAHAFQAARAAVGACAMEGHRDHRLQPCREDATLTRRGGEGEEAEES
eukprot:711372-Hanusia_phi.AAC.1